MGHPTNPSIPSRPGALQLHPLICLRCGGRCEVDRTDDLVTGRTCLACSAFWRDDGLRTVAELRAKEQRS